MFLKKNVKKVRSLFSGFAFAGLAATALFLSANTPVNAQQTEEAPTVSRGGPANKFGNFRGTGRTDFTTLGFTTGGPISWFVTGNPASATPNAAFIRIFNYGLSSTDSIVTGDFFGDSKTELSVYRTSTTQGQGIWYQSAFPTGTTPITLDRTVYFGRAAGDVATTGDYDGDGKADYCVVRVEGSTLTWYILNSATSTVRRLSWGAFNADFEPSVFNGADFNGDGRDEILYVDHNASGTQVNYYAADAQTNAGVLVRSFGNYNTDTSLTPADYTGDGKADLVCGRQTATDGVVVWFILNSATGVTTGTRFGIADPSFMDGDILVRGDYDGDNRHDIAVWRSSDQTFYFMSSAVGNVQSQKSGRETDFPLGGFGGY